MNPSQTDNLTGMVHSIIYHNEENGFTVFTVSTEDDETTTCTGYISAPLEGETLKMEGTYVQNPRYGLQLSVSKMERTRPNTVFGIEKYLASGVIKGLGAKTAKLIVARFGDQTFDILENEPERIAKIKGISLKKALGFAESFHAQADQRRVMLFLQEYGISSNFAMKIYKRYKEETIEAIKANPFRLADDIDGIGFRTADAIAHKLGISRDAPERISAGVRYCLWEAAGEGHTCIPTAQLTHQASEMLLAPAELIEGELIRMQMDRLIVREKVEDEEDSLVFLSTLYYAEISVSAKLSALSAINIATDSSTNTPDNMLFTLERETGITLSSGQRQAVVAALSQGVLIITGGPGTGKTTTINTIIGMLEARGLEISLAAPNEQNVVVMSP